MQNEKETKHRRAKKKTYSHALICYRYFIFDNIQPQMHTRRDEKKIKSTKKRIKKIEGNTNKSTRHTARRLLVHEQI